VAIEANKNPVNKELEIKKKVMNQTKTERTGFANSKPIGISA